MLARRLNGKYLAPHCEHLDVRVEEIREGKFEALIEDLMEKPLSEIKELYNHREIESVRRRRDVYRPENSRIHPQGRGCAGGKRQAGTRRV